jgi:membrane-bound lytic murein transglycosylase B
MNNRRTLLSALCAAAAAGQGLGWSPPAWAKRITASKALGISEDLADRLRFGWLGRSDVQEFISDLANRQNISRQWIEDQFRPLGVQPRALALMNPPPPRADEPPRKRSWARYLAQHADLSRVRKGREFIDQYRDTFDRVFKKTAVPDSVISAIIGVETKYGQFTGRFPLLETLATLAFESPRRNEFFKGELESALIMGHQGVIDLPRTNGSFAGALGLPQFMPSSWRNFAVSHDGTRAPDLLNNSQDAIASVANFLVAHGWRAGEPSHTPALIPANRDVTHFVAPKLAPIHTVGQLAQAGIEQALPRLSPTAKASLIDLPEADGTVQYWIASHNFFVVTHYNRSFMYAAAVLTLSEQIAAAD